MRFDYLTAVSTKAVGVERYHEALSEIFAQADALERGPYTTMWFGEHHFEEADRDVVPNPVMMAAFVASRTQRIRLGIGAATLPVWHPVRLAEDISMLDHFSGGRIDCGLSRGISAVENATLNPLADRRDAEVSWRLWEESVNLFLQAITDEALVFDGEFYTLPGKDLTRRGRPGDPVDPRRTGPNQECLAVTVLPKPYQKPGLPLFSTTESQTGAEHAADNDLSVITWYPTGQKLLELIESYRTRAGDRAKPIVLTRPFLIAETDEEARRLAEDAVEKLARGIQGNRGPGVWSGDDEADDGRDTLSLFDYLMSQGQLLVGSAETVSEQIATLVEKYGIEHLLLWGNLTNDIDVKLRSLELFSTEIAPRFIDAN